MVGRVNRKGLVFMEEKKKKGIRHTSYTMKSGSHMAWHAFYGVCVCGGAGATN